MYVCILDSVASSIKYRNNECVLWWLKVDRQQTFTAAFKWRFILSSLRNRLNFWNWNRYNWFLCESLRITNTIPVITHSISHRLQRAVTTRTHILGSKALTTIIRLIQINTVGLWYYTKPHNDIAAAVLVYFFTNKKEKMAPLRFHTHKCCLEIKQAFVQCGLFNHTNDYSGDVLQVVYGKGHIHEYGNGRQLRGQLWNNPLHKPMDTWNLSFLNITTVNAYVADT